MVTGASSGLGEEYARQLAARGANLVVVARRLERLHKLAAELKAAHGVEVETHPLDLGEPGSPRKLFELAFAPLARRLGDIPRYSARLVSMLSKMGAARCAQICAQ